MEFVKRACKCVVFIGGKTEMGQFIPYGTGFLISKFTDDSFEIQFDYVVTCVHVVDIAESKIWIRVNLIDGGSEIIETLKDSWFLNRDNDIAILSRYFSNDTFDVARIIEQDFVTNDVLIRMEVEPGDETFTVGLFTSHEGFIRNMPIVRMGNIAAIPKEKVLIDIGYREAYLVESRSIGGLSGSPVFLLLGAGIRGEPESSVGSFLLGMMQGRLNTTDANDVVGGDSITDTINTGIGVVIPVDIIRDTINHPHLIAQREDTVKKLKKESHYRPCATSPSNQENPQHKEDFNSLVSAATKKKPRDD